MKKIFLAVAITAICTGAFAQKESDRKFGFSVGPEIGFAVGNFSNTHSVGVGATIQGDFNIATSTNFTLTTGYLSYAGKSAGSGIKFKAAGIIPLKAGIKYFLSQGFYGAAQLGAGFFNNGGGTALAYTPMLGYEFDTKSGKAVDASLKYDGYSINGSGLGSVGVRLAYRF
ncbi:hypothetical protein [Ferruginibacter sp. SUN106]|uniref:hypothetical protein n=1 Tax=Ferruginibacter sp. SUN106 TaxID=2978348 RepID=UPI003D35E676